MKTNKVAIITGGTKGVGLATANLFAQKGYHLILGYRSDKEAANKAESLIKSHGVDCQAIESDLVKDHGITPLFEAAKNSYNRLDTYIHNAAATAFKPLIEIQPHHVDKTFAITVKSFICGVQLAVPLMSSGGSIVTVSGMDNKKAVPRHGLLGAAKSSLETLTSYFAHDLANKNIHVNGVNPGFLRTESTEKYLGSMFKPVMEMVTEFVPTKREAKLEEIANVIYFLCSDESSWIVGQTINVDGGQDFCLPGFE